MCVSSDRGLVDQLPRVISGVMKVALGGCEVTDPRPKSQETHAHAPFPTQHRDANTHLFLFFYALGMRKQQGRENKDRERDLTLIILMSRGIFRADVSNAPTIHWNGRIYPGAGLPKITESTLEKKSRQTS